MTPKIAKRVGFTCAYTPLPLLHAAGLEPYRILPVGEAPDQAGALLHDNLCPHVKRILDRGLADDLPDLSAVVIIILTLRCRDTRSPDLPRRMR